MPVRKAEAEWKGNLPEGSGRMAFGGGAFQGAYSFKSRFEEGTGTNPEELIAAAHAGCFSMALSNELAKAGHTPESVRTTAKVYLEKVDGGFGITRIHLETEGRVPGLDADTFKQFAQSAKQNCPVSKVLTGADISVDAKLAS